MPQGLCAFEFRLGVRLGSEWVWIGVWTGFTEAGARRALASSSTRFLWDADGTLASAVELETSMGDLWQLQCRPMQLDTKLGDAVRRRFRRDWRQDIVRDRFGHKLFESLDYTGGDARRREKQTSISCVRKALTEWLASDAASAWRHKRAILMGQESDDSSESVAEDL